MILEPKNWSKWKLRTDESIGPEIVNSFGGIVFLFLSFFLFEVLENVGRVILERIRPT